ncbi:MAG: hypothetical protein ACPG06_10710, partial [Alphaproteobacteria bacterium]
WPQTRTNFFLFRCFVSPPHRRTGIATALFNAVYAHLHGWADDNRATPVEGLLFFADVAELQHKNSQRMWAQSGLSHAGYRENGTPVYARWFLRPAPTNLPSPEIEIRNIWQNVSHQDGDAIADMWRRFNALPQGEDPQQRLKHAACAAFLGDRAVGVLTVGQDYLPLVKAKVLLIRVFVADEQRSQKLPRALSTQARPILHEWIRNNPQTGLEGIASTIQAPAWQNRPDLVRPTDNTELTRIGFTPKGYPLRLAWSYPDNMPNA